MGRRPAAVGRTGREFGMADCECLAGCPFFNDKMASMPALAGMLKSRYCKGNSADCARHMVFKARGKPKVPPDLFPNQVDRAKAVIAAG
jgi:hypothetical protein